MKQFLMITGSICLVIFLLAACAVSQGATQPESVPVEASTASTDLSAPTAVSGDNAQLDIEDFMEQTGDTAEGQNTVPAPSQTRQPESSEQQPTQPAKPDAAQTAPTTPTQPAPTQSATTAPQAPAETTAPEETVQQTTVPETTVPETTVPEIEQDGYFSQIIRP